MARAANSVSKPAPELRFWACFAVVFALVAQAMFPVQALAMPNRDGTAFILCTGDADISAAKSQTSGHTKGLMGLKCADCVIASITAVETTAPATLPVRYAVRRADLKPTTDTAPVKARAPPPPRACGPPASFIA